MKLPVLLLLFGSLVTAIAADTPQSLSAGDIAGKLSEALNSGSAEIRLRMLVQKEGGQKPETLQVRIRQQRSDAGAKAVYEVLFPAERKGEAAYLSLSGGGSSSGTWKSADGKTSSLKASDAVLGSDLAVADAVENFFAWKNQSLAGSEKIGSVDCAILDSKSSGGSPYTRVKSWIDTRRMVPLKIEKYDASGKLVRRITTTRVVPDAGRQIPGDLKVETPGKGTQTLLDGSSIKHDVNFSAGDLSPSR